MTSYTTKVTGFTSEILGDFPGTWMMINFVNNSNMPSTQNTNIEYKMTSRFKSCHERVEFLQI